MKEVLCILVVCFLSKTFGALDKNKAGPFDVVLERIEPCPGYENDEYKYTYKLKKYNRTTLAIDVDAHLPSPVENNMKVSFIVDQFANNGWKENYFKKDLEGDVCKMSLMFIPDLAHRLFKIAKVKSCPIPAGNYSARNFPLVVEIKTIPVFFYNKYRAKLTLKKNNKRLFCLFSYANVVPKRIRKG